MKITMFIGNGFDLNLGMKTRYSDFYEYYQGIESPNIYIQKMKYNIKENLELWSDLENRLRTLVQEKNDYYDTEYLDFVDDLIDNLTIYIQKENSKLVLKNENANLKNVFYRSLSYISKEISKYQKEQPPKDNSDNSKDLYSFVDFNYTNSLHTIAALANFHGTIIQPHGDLLTSMVIGVSDLKFRSFILEEHPDLNRWLIKKNLITRNEQELGNRYNLTKELIESSDAICIYGMSLGDSDRMWWEEILNWLIRDANHNLLIFSHSIRETPSLSLRQQYIKRGEPIVERFISFANIQNNDERLIKNQIRVISGKNLFHFITKDNKETLANDEIAALSNTSQNSSLS